MTLSSVALLAALTSTASAERVLRLGDTSGIGSTARSGNLTDFTNDDGWTEQFVYDAGTLPTARSVADLPQRMAATEADCDGLSCASMLTVTFELPVAYDGERFELVLDRYGSEYVHVFVDGDEVGGMSGQENIHMRSSFHVGALAAGEHTLMLWTTGAGNIGEGDHHRFALDRIVLNTL